MRDNIDKHNCVVPPKPRCPVLVVVILSYLLGGSAYAQQRRYQPLDDFATHKPPNFGPVDLSIAGFFSAVQRDSLNKVLNQGGGPGDSEFPTLINQARSAIDEVPIPSGSTSVTFVLDPKLEVFVATELPLAPAISLNAHTNGKNILALGASYSHLDYSRFGAFQSDNILFLRPTINDPGQFDVLLVNLKLRQDFIGLSAQFGLTDNLDLGIFLPVVHVDFSGRAIDDSLTQVPDGKFVIESAPPPPGHPPVGHEVKSFRDLKEADFVGNGIRFSEDKTGIGDLIIRSKYFIGSSGPVDCGAGLNLSVPTGDQDNLLGVGTVRFDPRLILSGGNALVTGHANASFHVDQGDHRRNRFDYSTGAELRITKWLSLLVDHLGRIEVAGVEIKKFEMASGVKINPYKEWVVGFNAIIPINHDGLTTSWIPSGMVEASVPF